MRSWTVAALTDGERTWGLADVLALEAENARLRGLIGAPELADFTTGVVLEAAHQRLRWGSEHDAGKTAADWFWLLGYLAGKALASAMSGDTDKLLHHCISSGAVLANWHAQASGRNPAMRPGIDTPEVDV
jgi:hypothetical protein